MATKKPERVPSEHERYLEAVTSEDYVPGSALGTQYVQPNPLGDEAEDGGGQFVGTDAIYQNRANSTEQPYPVEEDSPEGKALAAFAANFDLSETDEDQVVDDDALGGQAELTVAPGATLVPSDVTVGDSSAVNHASDEVEEEEEPEAPPAPPKDNS